MLGGRTIPDARCVTKTAVIPANAGNPFFLARTVQNLDSRFQGNDSRYE